MSPLCVMWAPIILSAWHTFLSCFFIGSRPLTRWKLLTEKKILDWLKPEGWWHVKLQLDANQLENCPQADHAPWSLLPYTVFNPVACLQMRKLRHRGTQDVCLAWYLTGSRAGMEGATGLFASRPSFLYHSTSKQEGLTVTTQNPAVRFWTLLTCQLLFWVKNSHCSFSVDPDLYSAMKTEGLLTICSPRALSWESSWPLMTSLSFSVLP